MDDEFYYLALSVKNRIIEECVAKYGNLKLASLKIFDGSIWLYRDDPILLNKHKNIGMNILPFGAMS